MSAVVFKCSLQNARNQANAAAAVASVRHYSSDGPKEIKRPSLTSLKRGTGGRSSFSGIVATVFGSTGFLGRYVCNQLGKIGSQIILPYRGDNYYVGPLKLVGDLGQVLFHPFDLRDDESIRKAVKYSNLVINLIGRDWETKNYNYHDVHVDAARRIARISREMGVEKFLHVSALNANPDPTPLILPKGSQLLKYKWLGEQAVREEFPDAIIFRPSEMYGYADKFLIYYLSRWRRTPVGTPIWKKGMETIKQPVYVADVARGIVNAVRDRDAVGKVYQAVGPHRYKLHDLVDYIYRIIRRENDIRFRIYDLKYNPLFMYKVKAQNLLAFATPFGYVHPEAIEAEHITDKVLPDIPTLEDLGVTFTSLEAQVPWELKMFKAHSSYDEQVGEFSTPDAPVPVS